MSNEKIVKRRRKHSRKSIQDGAIYRSEPENFLGYRVLKNVIKAMIKFDMIYNNTLIKDILIQYLFNIRKLVGLYFKFY